VPTQDDFLYKINLTMKKILTADNTETFLNTTVGESYHSQTGAVEEALKKYALPCKIKELALSGHVKILDICSGLGYNSAMAIDVALEVNPACKITIIGLEYDPEIINKIQEVDPPIKAFKYYKKLSSQNLTTINNNISITFILGDARETIKSQPNDYFDAIFFDPFSPKTAPEMWQIPFFKETYRVMRDNAILATYSCARVVRDNMSQANLFYDDGPIVGRRGPGTIATKWLNRTL
jgi:tRNA U34 5-methylaminomethyl-2-thiouridine-forming methyltransferase MnmC